MPIAIVAALPKSSSASASSAAQSANPAGGTATAGNSEGSAPASDFANLLLGQLIAGAAPASTGTAGLTAHGTDDDTGVAETAGSDPLAILAALAQAPQEQRLPTDGTATAADNAGTAARGATALSGDQTQLDALARQAQTASTSETAGQAAANDADGTNPLTAKFAVPTFDAEHEAGELDSTLSDSINTGTSHATLALTGHNHVASQEATTRLAVSTPVHERGWAGDFAQKVSWMANSQNQVAELTLNPPSMGSIEVSLHINNDTSTATATFVSSNADVRESIETALPRLREMLAGIGIQLGEANVNAESFRQQTATYQEGSGGSGNGGTSTSPDDAVILASGGSPAGRATLPLSALGLVDTFV